MTSRRLLLVRPLWSGNLRGVLIDLPLLAAVAATIVFFGGLVTKDSIDGALFFSRASFDEVATTSDPPGPQAIGVLPRFPVIRARAAGESTAFTPELQTLEVDVVPDLVVARAVLGDNLVKSSDGLGALLDVDSARRLGVGIGDSVVLDAAAIGGRSSAAIVVVGILAPYASPRARGETGLVVVPSEMLPAAFVASVAGLLAGSDGPIYRTYGAGLQGSDVRNRGDLTESFLTRLIGRDVVFAVGGMFAFAGLLWIAVLWRGIGRAMSRTQFGAAVLVALGAEVRGLANVFLVPVASVALVAGALGAILASQLIFPVVLGAELQPLAVVPMLVILAVGSAVLFVIARRQLRASVGDGTLLRALSGTNE